MRTRSNVWVGSRRMWVEIALGVLVIGLVFIALGMLLNVEGRSVPDDHGDDGLAGVRPILQVAGSLVSLVIVVVLVAFFEAARLAQRAWARRRSTPPQ